MFDPIIPNMLALKYIANYLSEETMKILISLLVCISLAGCVPNSAIKKPQPINLDPKEGSYVGVATEANQRLVLATAKKPKKVTPEKPGKANKDSTALIPIICAEPFPDGGSEYENLNKFISEKGDKKIGLEKNVTFNVTLPYASAPAVKFYRDGVFALCQAAMNGWIETDHNNKKSCATQSRDKVEQPNIKTLEKFVEKSLMLGGTVKDISALNIDINALNIDINALTKKKNAARAKVKAFAEPQASDEDVDYSEAKVDYSEAIVAYDASEVNLKNSQNRLRNLQNTAKELEVELKDLEKSTKDIIKPDTCTEFEIQLFRLRDSAEEIMKTEAEKAKANARTAEANARTAEANARTAEAKAKAKSEATQ
ncbi:MAG: hypothetical protein ACNYNY_06535 [Candidatus Oxydemutatoraceae bacterium WSBS_2016_MAG_OTU14]